MCGNPVRTVAASMCLWGFVEGVSALCSALCSFERLTTPTIKHHRRPEAVPQPQGQAELSAGPWSCLAWPDSMAPVLVVTEGAASGAAGVEKPLPLWERPPSVARGHWVRWSSRFFLTILFLQM